MSHSDADIERIYNNPEIMTKLQESVSGETFSDPSWQADYLGYSERTETYVIATYVSMSSVDSAGFWAFKVDESCNIIIKHIYFGSEESSYWEAISIAKFKYPDLVDLVLD